MLNVEMKQTLQWSSKMAFEVIEGPTDKALKEAFENRQKGKTVRFVLNGYLQGEKLYPVVTLQHFGIELRVMSYYDVAFGGKYAVNGLIARDTVTAKRAKATGGVFSPHDASCFAEGTLVHLYYDARHQCGIILHYGSGQHQFALPRALTFIGYGALDAGGSLLPLQEIPGDLVEPSTIWQCFMESQHGAEEADANEQYEDVGTQPENSAIVQPDTGIDAQTDVGENSGADESGPGDTLVVGVEEDVDVNAKGAMKEETVVEAAVVAGDGETDADVEEAAKMAWADEEAAEESKEAAVEGMGVEEAATAEAVEESMAKAEIESESDVSSRALTRDEIRRIMNA